MKKVKIVSLAALIGTLSVTQTSCIGSFSLTSKVYQWNQSFGDKWVNELVFIVLLIVPVYEISFFLDGVILNSIEFWTGTNPVALKPGETESEIVEGTDGNRYQITASKNQFTVTALTGKNKGEKQTLAYSPKKQQWTFTAHQTQHEVATIINRDQLGNIEYTTPYSEQTQIANIFENQENLAAH